MLLSSGIFLILFRKGDFGSLFFVNTGIVVRVLLLGIKSCYGEVRSEFFSEHLAGCIFRGVATLYGRSLEEAGRLDGFL